MLKNKIVVLDDDQLDHQKPADLALQFSKLFI